MMTLKQQTKNSTFLNLLLGSAPNVGSDHLLTIPVFRTFHSNERLQAINFQKACRSDLCG